MDTEAKNGGGKKPWETSQLVLTLDRPNFLLTISGQTENYDEALAMLHLATRQMEDKIRTARVGQVLAAPAGTRLPDFRGRQ
jgi:hypothetical protein